MESQLRHLIRIFVFEMGSHHVAYATLELDTILSLPSELWDCGLCTIPHYQQPLLAITSVLRAVLFVRDSDSDLKTCSGNW